LDAALGEFSTAPVVKADGLCAGKGVVVANTHEEARSAALEMLDGSRFGDAGRLLVLEERLRGFELSVHALCDGNRSVFLPVARDYKRIGDGDEGPNTGGMGTFAPNPAIDEALGTRIREEIMDPLVRGFSREGLDYRGTLFAGLMVEHGVPHLLEINVRFGDPETQVLMGVLDGDFGELLCAAADGRLSPSDAPLRPLHSVCVVLAAAGYPGDVRSGDEIHGIERAEQHAGVRVYHAGTRRDGELLRTAGGRVVGVTAVAGSLAEARKQAYAGAAEVRFAGKQMRGDIAAEPR
jgi:phosphoribosylamine--glycine ligase